MSTADSGKWDRQFAEALAPGRAATVLRENLHLLPDSGNALEIACGLGANSLLLARCGLQVEAWDYSAVALAKLREFCRVERLSVGTRQIDVEQPFTWPRRYQVIVVTRYLHRDLCPHIVQGLEPGGLVFYQTFNRTKRDRVGPSNASYLLETNELLRLFAGLELVFYREDGRAGDMAQGERDCSLFIGKKPELSPATQ